jgi:hypothetical protein
MVDEGTDESSATTSRPRSKNGIPRVSLATAESYARGVWTAARAGEAVPVAVARAISGRDSTKASGGAWRTKITALRVFSLVERLKSENLKLSSIGLGVVNQADADKQREARRDAVMSVDSYAQILNNSNGHELPGSNSIAGTFEYEYSLATDDAKTATTAFLESVKHAELVDDAGVVHLDGSYVAPAAEEQDGDKDAPEGSETGNQTLNGEAAAGDAHEDVSTRAPVGSTAADKQTIDHQSQSRPHVPLVVTQPSGVDLNVTLDMSDWAVDDVIAVLRILGYGERETEQ